MISVIIGRFQTPFLHSGHLELFEKAMKHSTKILILIGVSGATGTDKNPLNYEIRKGMIENYFSKFHDYFFIFKPLPDCLLSDNDWSKQIDGLIEECGENEAIIFGGRDNSIKGYYSGKHSTHIIKGLTQNSATSLRKEIASKSAIYGLAARSAIIHHIENRYAIVYSTVDIIIKNDDKYLVGKKGDKYCFVGGFVDTSDNTLKDSALRELKEETGITNFEDINYCGSIKINDPRYKGTKDCIMTHCFLVKNAKNFGNEIQDKEFKDFNWATKKELEELLHDFHKPLLTFI